MKPNVKQFDLTSGHELLIELAAQCSTILRGATFELHGTGDVACIYEAADGVHRVTGATVEEAAQSAFVDVATFIASRSSRSARPVQMSSGCVLGNEVPNLGDTERFQAKARNQTIGVTMPSTLKSEVATLAADQGVSFSEVLRRLAVFGYDDFEERSLYASTRAVFQTLGIELQHWQDSTAEQVMMRLEPEYIVRLKSAAKEHERSASEMGALCVAHGIAMCKELKTLESRVKAYKGAAIRRLPEKVGLEAHSATLLAGVLTGSIRAPRELLRRLASVFSAPESLLATYFRRSFDQLLVPSFRAENGKPVVASTAVRWESAVKSSGLNTEQTKTLLRLGA